jgi:hypothetical protein
MAWFGSGEKYMKRFSLISFTFAAAAFFAACGAPADNKPAANNANTSNANAANTAAKPVAAAPTKDALMAIEKAGWEAWKTRDPKWNQENLSDKAIGFTPAAGRQDKAAMMKAFGEAKCDIKSFSFSDEQMSMLGPDLAVLTFKGAQDGTCDGKKVPANVWSSSVYVREGDKWKSYLYLENPVTDPKSPPKPAAAPVKKPDAAPATDKPDALTEALMAIETKAWDAWKQRDKAGIEGVMWKDFMYVSGLGRMTRADAIKQWGDQKCEGLDYKFSDAKAFSVTADVAVATYNIDVKGKCDGNPVSPFVWAASFSIKEGDAWKNAFYTDTNR